MPEASGPDALLLALASVARAIAGSLEVKEVWDRVAEACRTIVPFDAMGIVRLAADGRVHAVGAAGEVSVKALQGTSYARSDYSPALWPDADRFLVVVRDATRELDPGYACDRALIERGYRSAL